MALKGEISESVRGKTHCLGYSTQKSKVAHPVNYFPRFWVEILRIAVPVYYSYVPSCLVTLSSNMKSGMLTL